MWRRLPTVVLLGILMAASTLTALPAASAHHASGPCGFHRKADETIQHLSKRHIRCSVDRFGPVPGGRARAMCIAERESGLDPRAASSTEMYLGLFQHAATYWDGRYQDWTKKTWDLPDSALKGRTNAIVTIRMVHAVGGWKAAGWPRRGC